MSIFRYYWFNLDPESIYGLVFGNLSAFKPHDKGRHTTNAKREEIRDHLWCEKQEKRENNVKSNMIIHNSKLI